MFYLEHRSFALALREIAYMYRFAVYVQNQKGKFQQNLIANMQYRSVR